MWSLVKVLVTISLLHSGVQAVDIQTFTKDWTSPRESITFKYSEDVTLVHKTFAYAVCDESELPAKLNCDMKLETLSESSPDARVCHLKIAASENREFNNVTGGILSLEIFGEDKVMITGLENDSDNDDAVYLRVNVLDMAKCSNVQLIFPYDKNGDITASQVVTYRDTFDVIITSKTTCEDVGPCRVTYDQGGERVAGPVPFPINLTALDVTPILDSSSVKGFVVAGYSVDPDRLLVTRLGLGSTKTRLMKVEHLHPFTTTSAATNGHEKYGICWTKLIGDTEIHCAQFDARDDNAELNMTLTLAEKASPVAVHNMADDGLLLVTMNSQQSKCKSFEVTKFLKSGRTASFKVDGLDLHCGIGEFSAIAGVSESDDQFCFNFVSENPEYVGDKFSKRSMQFRSKCVSKAYVTDL